MSGLKSQRRKAVLESPQDYTTVLGALADSVQEVLDLEPGSIAPPPRIGTKLRTEFIKGMGKQDDRFVIILDIDRIFSSDELSFVQTAGTQPMETLATAAAL